jgi:hypothetical protein
VEHDVAQPIADRELLYRRVPASASPQRYDPATRELSDQAFAPHKTEDVSGISLSRADFKLVEEAAKGRAGKSYYVAVLRAGDIRQAGMSVEPRPHVPGGYDLAHAELPDLNSRNRKESKTLERQRILVELCLDVVGPFDTPQE